jgi:prepilin signal peptidase PulO-like enzyme (type II secretory pathway)
MPLLIGVVLSGLIGWLVGAVGNWLADQLPHLPQRSLQFNRHEYLPTLLLPWRVRLAAEDARPWRRTLLAAGMAASFIVGWLRFGDDVGQLLVAWFYTAWLLLVLVIDFEHRRVLNIMLPPAIVVTLLAPLFSLLGWANLPSYGSALLGGAAGFVAFLVIFVIGRGRMMGAGDVKLSGVIGLMTGYPAVWAALASGIFLGGIAAIFILIRQRGGAKSYMAYGPYLALGALLVLWFYWP